MNYAKVEQYVLRKLEKELPEGLHYHGIHHTLDVLDATIRLAKLEKVTKAETTILKTAALYHDAGFIKKYFLNEEVAAKMAKKSLVKFGYSSKQIQAVCAIILATKIEAKPQNKLEEIIRDADLDYLGRNDFYPIANTLRKELYEHGLKYTTRQWNKIMIDFLETHRFYTKSAKKKGNATKLKYIKQLKATLKVK